MAGGPARWSPEAFDGSPAVRRGTAGAAFSVTVGPEGGSSARSDSLGHPSAVWIEMRRRWSRGDRVPVEALLTESRLGDEDFVVDLAYAEYVLREEEGEAPDPGEFEDRFPRHREAIARQLALHRALSTTGVGGPASEPGSADAADLRCPGPLGKYFLIAPLGEGGQARVYRAVHPAIDRDLAIKVGRHGLSADSPEAVALRTEAKILAELDHPNLSRVYDLDFVDGRPYLVMEYIRGGDLAQWSRRNRPTPAASAALVARIARAAASAHAWGVVHRDIKPRNIVVDSAGEPRLIDFGLSRRQDVWSGDVPESVGLSGTLQFMAPEQARIDGAGTDHRSDVFALGGVLYFLLTGRAPYSGTEFAATLARVRSGEWDTSPLTAPHVPRSLRRICAKAMAEDPSERFQTATDLASALERFASRKRWALAAAAAGLIVAAGTAWAVGATQDGRETGDRYGADATVSSGEAVRKASPSLTLRVWNEAVESYNDLVDAAPLRNGTAVQTTVEAPAGLFVSMFLVTSEGRIDELLPGRSSTEAETIRFPSAEKAVPVVGSPGTEVVLVCGAAGAPVTLDEMRTLLGEKPWPRMPDETVLRIDGGKVEFEQQGRGFGEAFDLHDPHAAVQARADEVGRALGARCAYFEGLAFTHAE